MLVLVVAVAAVAAFLLSFAYYAVVPSPAGTSPDARPKPWQIAIELARSILVAALVGGILAAAGWSGPGAGALLGLALWILPLVLLAGSALWEAVPMRTAALHAGDWLIKLPAIGVIVGLLG